MTPETLTYGFTEPIVLCTGLLRKCPAPFYDLQNVNQIPRGIVSQVLHGAQFRIPSGFARQHQQFNVGNPKRLGRRTKPISDPGKVVHALTLLVVAQLFKLENLLAGIFMRLATRSKLRKCVSAVARVSPGHLRAVLLARRGFA